MNLEKMLKSTNTYFRVVVKNRKELFSRIANDLKEKKLINSKIELIKGLEARERQVSTALIKNIAIPHVQSSTVKEPTLMFYKLQKGVVWDTSKNNVDTIFVIAVPERVKQDHLTILSELGKVMVDEENIRKIRNATNYKKLLDAISLKKIIVKTHSTPSKNKYDIVAVTSCPTGIAHTYLSAEYLRKQAKAMGLTIKVETQGTDKVEGTLSANDIENSSVIILALDRSIDMTRFSGKKVYEVSTGQAIKDPRKVIKAAMDGAGKVVPSKGSTSSNLEPLATGQKFTFSRESFKRIGKTSYRAILSGVSYMLPFVIFGGIFIALAFLIDIDNAGASNYGSGSDVAKWFINLGGMAFGLFVAVFAAYIVYSVVGKVGLLPGFIVGLIANGNFSKDGGVGFFNETVSASGFLGAIIGAFLVIVIVIGYRKVLYKAPKSLHGVIGVLAMPLLVTGTAGALMWLINIPLGIANGAISTGLQSVATSGPVMVAIGLLVGCMMAFDMGGPINKAAYAFGVFTLSATVAGETVAVASIPMALVMLAGMIPPLAIAVSATFAPRLWTKEEREAGYTNWVMGLSFITEGAIPFAAKRPKVIIPSIMFGSAVGAMCLGLFSIGEGVTLSAPHGGIFVFALLSYGGNIGIGVIAFIACLIVGSVVGALMIPIMRKITKVKIVQDENVRKLSHFLKDFFAGNVKLGKSSRNKNTSYRGK